MKMVVVTAVNEGYVIPLLVMVHSLLKSLPDDTSVDLKILTRGLSFSTVHSIKRCFRGLPLDVEEIKIDLGLMHGLKVDRHVTIETYFRLFAPTILPEHEIALYLDADILVCESPMQIYCKPGEAAHISAVPNPAKRSAFFSAERGVPSYRILGIPGNTRTFNAGVMMMNLKIWREENTTREILEYLREHSDQVLWWDQDGLNAILHSKWMTLPAKWNVPVNHFGDCIDWSGSVLTEREFRDVLENPGIIHYSSSEKPWSTGYRGPFMEEWKRAFDHVRQLL